MLFLLLQMGDDRYAVEVSHIVDVLPLVNFKRTPQAPKGIAGFFNHHGNPVPLVDLTELMLGRPSQSKMSTRIILTEYFDAAGTKRLIGVLAEGVTETFRCAEGDFRDSGVVLTEAPYLGSITNDERGLIQRIEVKNLLSQGLRAQLFQASLSLTKV